MKIRFKHDIGVCEGHLNVRRGDVIDVPEHNGRRYVTLGYAEEVKASKSAAPVEKAVAPEHETAALEVPAETAAPVDVPKPLDEDEPPKPKPSAAAAAPRRR